MSELRDLLDAAIAGAVKDAGDEWVRRIHRDFWGEEYAPGVYGKTWKVRGFNRDGTL